MTSFTVSFPPSMGSARAPRAVVGAPPTTSEGQTEPRRSEFCHSDLFVVGGAPTTTREGA